MTVREVLCLSIERVTQHITSVNRYERVDGCLLDLEAAGYVIVPKEPTAEMCRSGAAMWHDTVMATGHPERGGGKFDDFELPAAEAWRAMIAKALKS